MSTTTALEYFGDYTTGKYPDIDSNPALLTEIKKLVSFMKTSLNRGAKSLKTVSTLTSKIDGVVYTYTITLYKNSPTP